MSIPDIEHGRIAEVEPLDAHAHVRENMLEKISVHEALCLMGFRYMRHGMEYHYCDRNGKYHDQICFNHFGMSLDQLIPMAMAVGRQLGREETEAEYAEIRKAMQRFLDPTGGEG